MKFTWLLFNNFVLKSLFYVIQTLNFFFQSHAIFVQTFTEELPGQSAKEEVAYTKKTQVPVTRVSLAQLYRTAHQVISTLSLPTCCHGFVYGAQRKTSNFNLQQTLSHPIFTVWFWHQRTSFQDIVDCWVFCRNLLVPVAFPIWQRWDAFCQTPPQFEFFHLSWFRFCCFFISRSPPLHKTYT